jgi:hypothetical protein
MIHVSQGASNPHLIYMATRSQAPGAGYAIVGVEARAFYATEGIAGLRGVYGSIRDVGRLGVVRRDIAYTTTVGGLAYWAYQQ